MIIGAHSHTVLRKPVLVPREQENGAVVILQAGDYWRFVGKANVRMEKSGNRFVPTSITAELIKIDETVAPDPEMEAFLQAARKPFEEIIAQEQPKRDMDAMFEVVQKAVTDYASADVVILDKGVIQAKLAKGPVTLGDIYRIHPWRNQILKTEIIGKELASILPQVVQDKKVVTTAAVHGNIADGGYFLINGGKIEQDRKYTLAINDYAISQCPAIAKLAYENTNQRIDEVLLSYFRTNQGFGSDTK
jgi:2',3'-cyclic-nucleotide 2'-phosphodiesterase (5'-nucleotidase family)